MISTERREPSVDVGQISQPTSLDVWILDTLESWIPQTIHVAHGRRPGAGLRSVMWSTS